MAVCPDPPELVPIIVVVAGQDTDVWIFQDVAQTSKLAGALRLMVDGGDDEAVGDDEGYRDDVGTTVVSGCAQLCRSSGRDPVAALLDFEAHSVIVRPRGCDVR